MRTNGYKLEPVPAEAKNVNERAALGANTNKSSSFTPSTPSAPSFTKAISSDTMEPCKMCKAQTEEALKAKEALTDEKSQHEKTKREKEKVDKELAAFRKEIAHLKKAASDAKKQAQLDKKKYEQSAKAKQEAAEAAIAKTKKQLEDVTAAHDRLRTQMREGISPLITTLKQLKEQNEQNRSQVAEMDASFTADVRSLDEVMKTHTLSRGNEGLIKEHEEEITAMQKDQRRVEREAAAWRLKAEAYATKLPDELNCVLNSHLPNLVQECIEKVHARVVALNSATASQLLGPEASAGAGMTQAGDEERAVGADLSQRTVLSGHAGVNSTPELPTPIAHDGEAAARTTGPDTQLTGSQGAGGASVSLKGLVNGSQGASPGGPIGQASGMKRLDVASEPAEHGDGKRRRVGSARGAAYDSPENHSQANMTSNGSERKQADGVENGRQNVQSQQDRKTTGAKKSAGKDSSGPADLMKKLAALPRSHEGMDF